MWALACLTAFRAEAFYYWDLWSDQGPESQEERGKEAEKVLVFVGMKRTAAWLTQELWRKRRIAAVEIHGDLTQPERERSLSSFKEGSCPVMVATEVAARGLDIPKVAKVGKSRSSPPPDKSK